MKRIVLIILIFFFPFFVNANTVKKIITIRPNGDIEIEDYISIIGDYNGFEAQITYRYFDENAIYSAEEYELIKVGGIDRITNNLKLFEEVDYAEIGDSGLYTLSNENNKFIVRMYNPSHKDETFYINYVLKDVVVIHDDIAELKLNLIGGIKDNLDTVTFELYLPSEDPEYRIWFHGPLRGEIKRVNDKYVEASIDNIRYKDNIDLRLVLDKELLYESSKYSYKEMLPTILKEEEIQALKANIKRIFLIILPKLWLLGIIIMFFKSKKGYKKEHGYIFKEKYYRDIPIDFPPEVVEFLFKQKITQIGFTACILEVIRKKGIIIDETNEKNDTLIFSENPKEELTYNEENARKILFDNFGDGKSFQLKEMKDRKKTLEFIKDYNQWLRISRNRSDKEDLFLSNIKLKSFEVLYSLIPLILLTIFNFIYIIIGFIYACYIFNKPRLRNKKGNEYLLKFKAFKRFLKDFGKFDDKELPEVYLWEKYLIYAYVFGLSKKLLKQMKLKMPTFDNNTIHLSTLNRMVITNHLSNSLSKNININISRASSHVNFSFSSGSSDGGFSDGGGFSGGGGLGGGSF